MKHEDPKMAHAKREALCRDVVDEIIDLLNKRVIHKQQAGEMASGEAIYVASSACARAAAIALCSQLQNKEDAPRIIETFIELFRGDCRAVLTTNEKGHTNASSKSVWDDLDKIVKH